SPIFGGTQNMGILGTLISLIYTPPKSFAPKGTNNFGTCQMQKRNNKIIGVKP
ncbi:MAG: hypothetical protein ACI8RD_010791, partial [Bacillariaceae sp.]